MKYRGCDGSKNGQGKFMLRLLEKRGNATALCVITILGTAMRLGERRCYKGLS